MASDGDERPKPSLRAHIEELRRQLASGELPKEAAPAIEAHIAQMQQMEAEVRLPAALPACSCWATVAAYIPIVQTKQAPKGVEYVADVSPARWVQDRLRDFATVRALVPESYPAYARIFHPAYRSPKEERPVRWSEIAAWTGRTVHPMMQFERIAILEMYRNPSWGWRPGNGSIPEAECRTLIEVLKHFTATPDRCWFCLWEGYGDINPRLYDRARVKAPGRDHLLFRGPLESVMKFAGEDQEFGLHIPPSIWWPDDRAWCVATDVDLPHSYVGGSEECIEALLARPELEALPARLDDAVYDDTINAPYGSAEGANG